MKPSSAVVNLGPWIKGIQNLYDPAMTPKGAVVEANNVLIESDGSVIPRAGYAPVTTNVHSLFKHNGVVYGLYNGLVCELYESTARPLTNTAVTGKVTWGVLNGEPVLTNSTILARVSGGQVKQLGVEMPVPTSPSAASPTLPLNAPAGEYAISFVNEDGEEGPLSPLGTAFLPPTEATVVGTRIYAPTSTTTYEGGVASSVSGGALYLVGSSGAGANAPIGMPAETMNKARMPGGDFVRYWRGRLLVARGRTLYFSDPLRYGLYDQSRGFVTFEAKIDFIESIETGIFVALRNIGVVFLAGDSPEKWERRLVDVVTAQPGASGLVPTALMDLKLQQKPEWVAVWMTNKGFALGLPSGNVMYPQADLLSGLPLGTGSLHFDGADRLIVLSQ